MGMGNDGSNAPQPWVQRQARTLFLRVPNSEWISVSRGSKREFRASQRAVSALWNVEPPTPVVAYRQHKVYGYDSKLMVLEEKWQEPLGAISAESLRREGFETLTEFRKHWMRRERRRFAPTRLVTCYRVRPWLEVDKEIMGRSLLETLYGEFLHETSES